LIQLVVFIYITDKHIRILINCEHWLLSKTCYPHFATCLMTTTVTWTATLTYPHTQ